MPKLTLSQFLFSLKSEQLKSHLAGFLLLGLAAIPLSFIGSKDFAPQSYSINSINITNESSFDIKPLAMKGGDPYIRALMRTISASESYDRSPYTIIYGGQHTKNLKAHPNVCVTIRVGVNTGNCSTAAGRYQFINNTWAEMAKRYHPHANTKRLKDGLAYSFSPKDQDAVLYNWLKDSNAWGFDISQMLQEGRVNEVLRLLSPTWTSLGYGIETNSMSGYLPSIYEDMLRQELKRG